MKRLTALLTLLLLAGCSGSNFTFNGLICPTDDMDEIKHDLASCRVYDLQAIDKALANDKECQECLEGKGYRIEGLDETGPLDANASR